MIGNWQALVPILEAMPAVAALNAQSASTALIRAFITSARGADGSPMFNIALAPALAPQVAVIASLCGVLAAIAPARRAAALDPAQAIRM